MATDIQFSELTDGTISGAGYFDVLMRSVDGHIDKEFKKGRIKGTDYANVYLGSMQSAIAQSMQFLLQEKLTEAQADGAVANTALAQSQLVAERNKMEAELEKHWGYDVTRDAETGELVLGDSTGTGKIDEEVGLTREKSDTEVINQESIKAKVMDEYGRKIDESGNNEEYNGLETKHKQTVLKMVADVKRAGHEVSIAEKKIKSERIGADLLESKMAREYGVKYEVADNIKTDSISFETAGTEVDGVNVTPRSTWEAAMEKATVEKGIGDATVKGYEADTYFKIGKQQQELMFGLANAGVISESANKESGENDDYISPDSVYSKIIKSMEISMNRQAMVWSDVDQVQGANFPKTPYVILKGDKANVKPAVPVDSNEDGTIDESEDDE